MKFKISINLFVFILFLSFFACSQENDETNAPEKEGIADKAIPVEGMVVRPGPVSQVISLTGLLIPIHAVDLIAEVNGTVIKIDKKVGDYVTPADILAVIDDKIPRSNFDQAQAQLLSAETNLKIAQLNLKSDAELYKNGDISELAYENSQLAIKNAEANYRSALANLSLMKKTFNDTRIQSPIAGLVARKYVDIGTMVTQNMAVYRVVDISQLKVEVGIPQEIITRVRKGNPAEFAISGLGGEIFSGRVRYISPQADEKTGAFMTEIHIQNTSDNKIRAGMTARITLTVEEMEAKLAIPDHAIVTKNGTRFIYKISNNHAVLSKVTIADVFGTQVIIESGLAAQDTIVVVGMKNLGTDTKVWLESLRE